MAENIKELTSADFDSTIKAAGKPSVVDFWAPWCGPCKALTPILEEVAGELGDAAMVFKVNVDENQEVAQKHGVRAIPTLLFFNKEGEMVDQVVGLTSKEDLKKRLS
ncbi:thioredoxin [Puniceicoccus vermicola]|uniref:Thioredoxin n=1 Tax=Puniceicoccus vermicola TaxID=388746 RepID=A0A7X1AY14_9BACT|nr:thioredoxin [Puniceicoccus vermicola]MBC2602037.1 thioredoxin [Puniceicoccus vermicola]